jgi:galactose mutarotase-like enzyme
VTAAPTGRQYELISGRQRAVVVELGAGLREYGSGAGPLVDGYAIDESPNGARGQLLLPWPNRIADATYRFSGKEYRLPINEPKTGSAIHGITRDMPWHLHDSSASAVTLALDLPPQAGYPFPLQLTATYQLDSDGLAVTITAANTGQTPCPYGAGAHPYVRLVGGGLIDNALLHIPAGATLEADSRGIPTGTELPVEGTAFDFRTPRPIGQLTLDTAFTNLTSANAGITTIALTSPDRSRGVAVWMDSSHGYAMVYSGDTLADVPRRRHGLAIEPMTCAPDAFNSDAGLVILDPGETHSATWGIAPL